jgi:hypothetical protein
MFGNSSRQEGIEISGPHSKVVAGNDNSNEHVHHHYSKQTKLSSLFDRLNIEYNSDSKIDQINEDLQRYITPRDPVDLQQKLISGQKEYLYDDAVWLKQEYAKKLRKYVLYEPAQQIHAFLLSIVIEKFRNIVYPLIRELKSDSEIMKSISEHIISPILEIIREEGCNDIMGLCATDIEGMVYYLTGRCHIKWEA